MIDRYVIRLVVVPSLAGYGLLLLLVTAFNAGELLRDAVVSQFPASYVVKKLLLQDLTASEVLLPTAVYVGLLVTMTHWHRDREAWALYAAGATPARLTRPLVMLSFGLALVIAGLSLVARPWAYAQGYALDAKVAHLSTDLMAPHRFYNLTDRLVISASAIDEESGDMRGVFVQQQSPEGVRVIRARTGRILPPDADRRQRVELNEGTSYWVQRPRGDRSSQFTQLTYVSDPVEEADPLAKRRARSTLALLDSAIPKEVAELQWRISMPLVALFVTLIGAELTRAHPSASVYSRYLLGIVTYALAFNIAAMGRTWVENGLVGALPGMYWVPALTMIAYLLIRHLGLLNLSRPR